MILSWVGYLIKNSLLYKTTGSALLDIFGSDLISDFFESEIILDSHGDSGLVAHGDVPELVRKVVATVNAHHLFAFLSAVRFYLLETFFMDYYASSQKRMPFITLYGNMQKR